MPENQRIGRYAVQRRLGAGGFALVWLGHDDVLDAPVAIKVLAENWAHQLDLRARFLEEARVLRRADSDRVVRVFDIGELDDGRPYFVMTYADRGTLGERLAEPMGVRDAFRMAGEIGRGVAVLHRLGVIHRDLKPSNVLLSSTPDGDERVLIADLGLAKAVAHASGFTVAAGSPGYMAPEQALMGGGLDLRTDVYGLGALTYRMLTGTTPERDEAGRLTPASSLRPGLPRDTDDVLARALATSREDRWPTVPTLVSALDGLARMAPASDDEDVTEYVAQPAYAEEHRPYDSGRTAAVSRAALAARLGSGPIPAVTPPPVQERTALFAPAPVQAQAPAPAPVVRRRKRRKWPVLTAVAVLLLGGGGYAAWRLTGDLRAGVVHVQDATKRLGITVPRDWGGQLQGSGWNPASIGLTKDTDEIGLTVSADVTKFRDPADATPGAFVGLTKQSGLAAAVTKLDHTAAGCSRSDPVDYRAGARTGKAVTWTCPQVTLTDLGLEDAGGASGVYVQLKQRRTDPDRTDQILSTLTG